jgi:hypothetical protein
VPAREQGLHDLVAQVDAAVVERDRNDHESVTPSSQNVRV